MSSEGRICPQCGYERQPKDLAPDYECPRCGIIYDKYVPPKPPAPSVVEEPPSPLPASPSTPTESPVASSALPEKDSVELDVARFSWERGQPEEAIARLEKYLKEAPDSRAAHALLAEIYLGEARPAEGLTAVLPDILKPSQRERKPPKVSPQGEKALFHALRARDLGGEDDPETIGILADALMQNRRSREALALLEETGARNPGNLTVWEIKIARFRERWSLGTLWQFFDSSGKSLFESKDVEAIRQRLLKGEIPVHAKCRKNRLGELKALTESIGREEERIRILFEPFGYHVKKGALWGAYCLGTIGALITGGWYIMAVVKGYVAHEFIDFFLSHLLVMIASAMLWGPLALAVFVLILGLVMGVGGVAGGLPGAVIGAPVGALVGLARRPFMPKLQAPQS